VIKNILPKSLLLVLSILLSFVISEGVLAALHFESFYGSANHASTNSPFCDVQSIEEAIDADLIKGRLGNFKADPDLGFTDDKEPHGFYDKKDFSADYSAQTRILMLGDSFTAGASAEPGHSFVDLLGQHYQDESVLFFNTGMGGYGQNNELAVLKKYFDTIQPHIVMLGFYTGNDFLNNLTPVDRGTRLGDHMISNYDVVMLSNVAHVRKRTSEEIIWLHKKFLGCPKMGLGSDKSFKAFLREEIFYPTRVGTQTWTFLRILKQRWKTLLDSQSHAKREMSEDYDYTVTKKYLKEIQKFLRERNMPFYVLLIPDRHESITTLTKSRDYQRAVRLLNELSIPYLDPFESLTLEDYILDVPGLPTLRQNDHWNNSGHRKMFEEIKNCFGETTGEESLDFCLA
jgi:hypothetical protein